MKNRCPDVPEIQNDPEENRKNHSNENSRGEKGKTSAEVAKQNAEAGVSEKEQEKAEERSKMNANEEMNEMQKEASTVAAESKNEYESTMNKYAEREEDMRKENEQFAAKEEQLEQELDEAIMQHEKASQDLERKQAAFAEVQSALEATQRAVSNAMQNRNEAVSASMEALEAAMKALDLQNDAELELAMQRIAEGNLEFQLAALDALSKSVQRAIDKSIDELQRTQQQLEQEIEAMQNQLEQLQQQQQGAAMDAQAARAAREAARQQQDAINAMEESIDQSMQQQTTEQQMEAVVEQDTSNLIAAMMESQSTSNDEVPDIRVFFDANEMARHASESVGKAFCLHHVQLAVGEDAGSDDQIERTMKLISALVEKCKSLEILDNSGDASTVFGLETLEVIVRYGFADIKIFELLEMTDIMKVGEAFYATWWPKIKENLGFREMMSTTGNNADEHSNVLSLGLVGLHVKYEAFPGEHELTDLDEKINELREGLAEGNINVLAGLEEIVDRYDKALQEVGTSGTGVLPMIFGRVAAFKCDILHLGEIWISGQNQPSIARHAGTIVHIADTLDGYDDLAVGKTAEAISQRIENIKTLATTGGVDVEDKSLEEPCDATTYDSLLAAQGVLLKAVSPEDIAKALNDMVKILNKLDMAANDERWPGALFASENWAHVDAAAATLEVAQAFAAWSLATTEQYMRTLDGEPLMLQTARETLRIHETVPGVDFAAVLRRKIAFFEAVAASEITDDEEMQEVLLIQSMKLLQPCPYPPFDSKSTDLPILVSRFPEDFSKGGSYYEAMSYEHLFEYTGFTLVKRSFAVDVDEKQAEKASKSTKENASFFRSEIEKSGGPENRGLLFLAQTLEEWYHLQSTRTLALGSADINEIVKMLQDAIAFTRNVDAVSLEDEELLSMINESIGAADREAAEVRKMWDDNLEATGIDDAQRSTIARLLVDGLFQRSEDDWKFLLEADSLQQMPTAALHALVANIADECVESGDNLATITAKVRSLGADYTKSVVDTARTFLKRDVASQVLRLANADKSSFATARSPMFGQSLFCDHH